jgi:hypothetical protein
VLMIRNYDKCDRLGTGLRTLHGTDLEEEDGVGAGVGKLDQGDGVLACTWEGGHEALA